MRRRRHAVASVTGAALAAAAVAFLVTNPSDHRASVPLPAVRVPVSTTVTATSTATVTTTATTSTSATSESAVALELGGDPEEILPPDQVDPLLFLDPGAWSDAGLGKEGDKVRWRSSFDWEGSVAIHECDMDPFPEPEEVVGIVGFEPNSAPKTTKSHQEPANPPIGWQKVRDVDAKAAKARFDQAVDALKGCADRAKAAAGGDAVLTVEAISSLGIGQADRAVAVYKLTDTRGDDPFVEYVVVGYTANGRFTVIRVLDWPEYRSSDQSDETIAQAAGQLGEAALDRFLAAP
jgi:hypothetical protein